MWPFSSREKRQRIQAGRAEWDRFADAAASAEPDAVREALGRLQANADAMALAEHERRRRAEEAFRAYAEAALADGRFSGQEEAVWDELAGVFAFEQEDWQGSLNDIARRLLIVVANEGNLPTLESPKLLTNPGEAVHLEVGASLLGDERQELGGHYIGTTQVVTDAGTLSITSDRVVFLGGKRSFEFPYSSLLGTDVFTDGVRFQVSNDAAPLFTVLEGWGEVVVATVKAARANATEASE